ncbi:MAG: tetratricopeptide repeat protein, partial [Crocinitomicaceae bacterium]
MKKVRHIVNVLVFIVVATVSFAQSESELQEDAGKLFENEQYVDATPLYLQLLSLNPTSADYNFRYGACLLSNSYKKQDAIRYLNFAVKDGAIDPRAFYFHGKALHLNYQFEDAKSSYKKYLSKRGKKDKRYSVEREIEMCDNGKKLLAQFTDIIVSEKQEIDNQKFFRLYKNMQTIGGDILVSAEFQSKLDKKKGHIPIVHFPPQAKAIYYSSYGDDESTGKDIYIRRRLPNGGWGNPQILPGVVNTNEDEDFPYMHPSGDFLYFSSKGHNSMGGYDVFFSRYNPNINAFGKPENVDFAISSPDDDLFYVVDSLHKNAYFASSRQSQNGKLHVYNVRVARVPIQEIIVMGDFLSEINPENKSMFVNVTSNTNGAEVGKIKSNAKGKYSFVFPKGGKYNYEVTVDGSEDIYKFMVELPYLDEFRPLKQKAIHAMVDGQEVVRIVNLFDEKVEGAEALIADVIRKRAT